jgi:hypothetical protein
MTYLKPWYALTEEAAAALSTELSRELPPEHVLQGVPVKCVARRQDRDDVFFELVDGSGRLAAVHLTWQVEREKSWPHTVIYTGASEWLAIMQAHHTERDA